MSRTNEQPLFTPDGRYLVVRGRLWRRSDPALSETRRSELVAALMSARRAVQAARRRGGLLEEAAAHAEVDAIKRALGERGPVWWRDAAPDFTRRLARGTPYAAWFDSLGPEPGTRPAAASSSPSASSPLPPRPPAPRPRLTRGGVARKGGSAGPRGDRGEDGSHSEHEGPL